MAWIVIYHLKTDRDQKCHAGISDFWKHENSLYIHKKLLWANFDKNSDFDQIWDFQKNWTKQSDVILSKYLSKLTCWNDFIGQCAPLFVFSITNNFWGHLRWLAWIQFFVLN